MCRFLSLEPPCGQRAEIGVEAERGHDGLGLACRVASLGSRSMSTASTGTVADQGGDLAFVRTCTVEPSRRPPSCWARKASRRCTSVTDRATGSRCQGPVERAVPAADDDHVAVGVLLERPARRRPLPRRSSPARRAAAGGEPPDARRFRITPRPDVVSSSSTTRTPCRSRRGAAGARCGPGGTSGDADRLLDERGHQLACRRRSGSRRRRGSPSPGTSRRSGRRPPAGSRPRHAQAAEPGVVGGEQPGRPGAHNQQIDRVLRHPGISALVESGGNCPGAPAGAGNPPQFTTSGHVCHRHRRSRRGRR